MKFACLHKTIRQPMFSCIGLTVCMAAILFLFSGVIANAQEKDFCIWTTVNIEKKFSKKFTAVLSQEFRFDENASQLDNAFTNITAEYNFTKNLNASFNYRLINKRLIDGHYQQRNRIYVDVAYRLKQNDYSFTLRTRFQDQFRNAFSENAELPAIWYWRNKLTFKYNLKEFKPYSYFEIFYPLNDPVINTIDNLRFAVGCNYDFTKKHSVNLYYLINKEINVKNPVTSFIAGIEYTYSF